MSAGQILRQVARVVVYLAITGTAYFAIGPQGAIVVLFMIVLALFRVPNLGRSAALAAMVVLAIAALATVIEVNPTESSLNVRFAREREIASSAAAVAGVLAGSAVVLLALAERSAVAGGPIARARPDPRLTPDRRRRLAPYLATGALATGVRLVLAPVPVSDTLERVASNLRGGVDYLRGVSERAYPPLAPVVDAFLPVPTKLLLVLVGVAAALMAARLARVVGSRTDAWLAGGIAAVLPSMWGQQLPFALAALFTVCAVLLSHPERLSNRRAAGAGACAGLAILATPAAWPVVLVLVASIRLSQELDDGDRDSTPMVLAFLGGAAIFVFPWLRWVTEHFGFPFPASGLGGGLTYPLGPSGLAIDAAVGVAAALALWDRRRRWRELLPWYFLPLSSTIFLAVTPGARGIWSWSAPIVVVLAAQAISDRAPAGRRTARTPARLG